MASVTTAVAGGIDKSRHPVIPEELEPHAAGIFSLPEGEEVGLGEEAVEAGVGLATLSHHTSKSEGLGLGGHLAVLVNVSNLDLDGGVV